MSGRMGVSDYCENYCYQQVYAELSETVGDKSGEVYGYPRGSGESSRGY